MYLLTSQLDQFIGNNLQRAQNIRMLLHSSFDVQPNVFLSSFVVRLVVKQNKFHVGENIRHLVQK